MHSGKRLRGLLVAGTLALLGTVAAAAQEIRFPDFSKTAQVANLQRNGKPTNKTATWLSKVVLHLSDGSGPNNTGKFEASSTYFQLKQPVSSGFTTYFSFQMHRPTTTAGSAEGFAFLIQNSSSVDTSMGASGAGLTAVGAGGDVSQAGALGYAGILNSLAVEFDINQNDWDPTGNHVSVQSCGPSANTPVHLPGNYTIGQNTSVTSCLVASNAITSNIPRLAGTCTQGVCTDGAIHFAVIEYTPPQNMNPSGTLKVWVDPVFIQGTHTPKPTSLPKINIPYTITALSLDNGSAWVGFTASQSTKATVQDVREWEFTPHTPTTIQQKINNDGTSNIFTFGAHDQVVTYPAGSNPNGLLMTVVSTPTDAATFYRTRLLGTQFQNEMCVTYLETGGNCIVYSVTCQDPHTGQNVTCPSTTLDQIMLSTSYYTADPITPQNADYLKADPIGTNNWVSICNPQGYSPPCYNPNTFDGTTSGKGHDLSDLVATFKTSVSKDHPTVAEQPKPVATEARRAGLQ
jgi:hypothetical protein